MLLAAYEDGTANVAAVSQAAPKSKRAVQMLVIFFTRSRDSPEGYLKNQKIPSADENGENRVMFGMSFVAVEGEYLRGFRAITIRSAVKDPVEGHPGLNPSAIWEHLIETLALLAAEAAIGIVISLLGKIPGVSFDFVVGCHIITKYFAYATLGYFCLESLVTMICAGIKKLMSQPPLAREESE